MSKFRMNLYLSKDFLNMFVKSVVKGHKLYKRQVIIDVRRNYCSMYCQNVLMELDMYIHLEASIFLIYNILKIRV